MSRISLWNGGKKSNDYRFFDSTISQYFAASGTAIFCHLYLGPHEQDDPVYNPPIPGKPNAPVSINERSIQDVLFLENRDRKYSDVVYELRGLYNVADMDFDLRQFGLFLQNDTVFIEIHLADCINLCGRRLIPGDVIELPHLRDDSIPGGLPAINKFYVVEDASKASDGYSSTWYAHIWRIKCTPMPASQEFQDILDKNATNPLGFLQGGIGDLLTNLGTEFGINELIVEKAVKEVPKRFFETRQFYLCPDYETVQDGVPWIFAGGGDAIPPNGAELVGSGTSFPANGAEEGSYYLRTDYSPPALFIYHQGSFRIQEINWRTSGSNIASRVMQSFINNDSTDVMDDGTVVPTKISISRAARPRADF